MCESRAEAKSAPASPGLRLDHSALGPARTSCAEGALLLRGGQSAWSSQHPLWVRALAGRFVGADRRPRRAARRRRFAAGPAACATDGRLLLTDGRTRRMRREPFFLGARGALAGRLRAPAKARSSTEILSIAAAALLFVTSAFAFAPSPSRRCARVPRTIVSVVETWGPPPRAERLSTELATADTKAGDPDSIAVDPQWQSRA